MKLRFFVCVCATNDLLNVMLLKIEYKAIKIAAIFPLTKRFQLLFLYFQNKWMKKKQQHDNHCHCAMFIVYFFFWIYLYERENRCNQISWKYRWKKHKRRKCEFQSILDILFDWSSCLKITCTQPQYGMLRTIFARIPHSVHKLSFR